MPDPCLLDITVCSVVGENTSAFIRHRQMLFIKLRVSMDTAAFVRAIMHAIKLMCKEGWGWCQGASRFSLGTLTGRWYNGVLSWVYGVLWSSTSPFSLLHIERLEVRLYQTHKYVKPLSGNMPRRYPKEATTPLPHLPRWDWLKDTGWQSFQMKPLLNFLLNTGWACALLAIQ